MIRKFRLKHIQLNHLLILLILLLMLVFRFHQGKTLLRTNLFLINFSNRGSYEYLQLFKEGSYQNSNDFDFCLYISPQDLNDETVWLSRGITSSLQGNFAEAYAYWKNVDHRSTFVALAKAHEEAQQWNEALLLYELAINAKRDDVKTSSIYFQIGYMHQFLSKPADYNRARDAYLQAINWNDFTDNNQDIIDTYQYLGNIYFEQKNFMEASIYYKNVLDLDPSRYWTHLNYAGALWHSGKRMEAINIVKHTIDMRPEEKTAYWYLARYLERTGQIDSALQIYAEIIHIDPNDNEARQKILSLTE